MNIADLYTSAVPLYAIVVSLAIVPLIILSAKRQNLREFWTIAAGIVKFLLVLTLLPGALENRVATVRLFEITPNIQLALKADAVGVFFAIVASGLWILTSIYSIGYMRRLGEHKQTRYFSYFAVCVSATIGIAFAANLVTFILFYEILTIATYPLVIHKETKEAIYAGRKYLAFTLTGGVFLIAAAAWTYQINGNLDFVAGGLLQGLALTAGTALPLFFLFIAGVGVKASIMPFHSWLPTAMAAPTPVSALLHAVAVVKAGVFGIIRVSMFIFGPDIMVKFGLNKILIVFAVVTILVGSFLALKQDNLKKRLAYSTISHLSYIVLGVGIMSSTALIGRFFCAGAIYVHLHKENISEMDGIGKSMPWTMGAFAIASMGLAGIPPINGFISKWYLGVGAANSGLLILIAVLVISGVLNAAYFSPILYRSFFRKGQELKKINEAKSVMVIPLVLTAFLSLLFGLFPNLFFKFFRLAAQAAAGIFGGIHP